MRAIVVSSLIALSVPAAAAPKFDPAKLQQLEAGMSEAEVVALLGKPSATAYRADGTRVLVFTRIKSGLFSASATSAGLLIGSDGKFLRVLTTVDTRNH